MYIDRLKEIIEKDNITITSMCKYINLDRSTLGKYISGYLPIPVKHLNEICNHLNISLDYVFKFTNIKKYKNLKQNIDIQKLGNRLKEFRKENKLFQEKLAKLLNCTHSAISEYEHNKRFISISHLYQICKKYNISADYLLGKIDSLKYLN